MATITLVTPCGECAKSKKMNRLMQHLGEDEVFCKEGHRFTDSDSLTPVAKPARKASAAPIPSAEKVVPGADRPSAAATVAEPPPNLEEVASPLDSLDEEEALPEMTSDERSQAIADGAGEALREAEEPADVLVELPAEVVPPEAVNRVYIAPGSSVWIVGGAIELRMTIPDQFVTSLQATAEAMGKTLEEHFAETVEHGLLNGWFF